MNVTRERERQKERKRERLFTLALHLLSASESHAVFLEHLRDSYLKGQAVRMSGPLSEQIKYSATIKGLGTKKGAKSVRQIEDPE